jgi:two-component system, OmpR family, sensor histidine kinase TctE
MTPSIRVNLLKWLIGPLLLINLIGAGLMYWLAWTPAQLALDQSLADGSWALIPHLHSVGNKIEIDLNAQAEQVLRVDHFDKEYFVVRDGDGRTIAGDADFPALRIPSAQNEPLPYEDRMRGEPVRVVSLKKMIDGNLVMIGAAETLRKRNQIRAEILWSLLFLGSALAAICVWIGWLAVSRGLLPLQRIAMLLRARDSEDLAAIDEKGLQSELRPVVHAMNGLLSRARQGTKARQDFLADVAHQLRTPLAGLRTQLDLLHEKYADQPDTAHSATLMLSSVERMIRRTNQLLAMARAEPSQYEKTALEPIRLDSVVVEAVQHFVHEADKKNIDIGFDLQPTMIRGDRFLLRDLVDNLIDNAIRYSPKHSSVTVICHQEDESGTFVIEDSGPGIPERERETIFERFYRIDDKMPGTGLGLAIVRDIARDHDAAIRIATGALGLGTVITIEFPHPSQ